MENSDSNNLVVSKVLDDEYFENDDIFTIKMTGDVESIGERAFKKCSNLTNIIFSDNCSEIGWEAFAGCERLEEIILPDSIRKIGPRAFADCRRLKRIVIPEGCSEIDWGAFAGCENLEEIVLPNSLGSLSPQLFLNCKKLRRVTLPTHIDSLPDEIFKGCERLDMKLNSNIVKVGNKAFENCYRMSKYPTQIIEAGVDSFRNCRNLKKVILNDKMIFLPEGLFDGCINLSDIHFSSNDKVVTAGERCFRNCKSLKAIPEFIGEYSRRMFENCTGLETINITSSVIPMACFRGCRNIKIINNSDWVEKIEAFAFSGCENLEEFTISNYLCNSISAEAFSHCKKLKKIYCEVPISGIGTRAFYDCASLEDNDFIDTVEYIKREAFRYCHSIKKIVIPEKLKSFGDYAFACMDSLERIEVSERNQTFMTPDNKILIHKMFQKLMLYASGLKDKSYSLKDYNYRVDLLNRNVVQPIDGIGPAAFAGAKNLEELTICGCTRNIESNAFEECDKLWKLNLQSIPFETSLALNVREHGRYFTEKHSKQPLEIPFKSVEFGGDESAYIDYNALGYFKNVEEVIFQKQGVYKINSGAFTNCNLTDVKIPAGVSTISREAFPKNTKFIFDNGLVFDNLLDLSTNSEYEKKYKLYTLEDESYYVELGDKITKITAADIERACSHSDKLRAMPVLYLDFMNDLFKNDLAIKQFFNGNLFCNISLKNRKLFLEYMDKDDKFSLDVFGNSGILDSDDYYTHYLLGKKNFKDIMNYIELLRMHNITNPLFSSKVLMMYWNIDDYNELLSNNYNLLERIFNDGDLLEFKECFDEKEANNSLEKLILENNYLKDFIGYIKKYEKKDRFLFKKPIIAIAQNDFADDFFKYFDANLKRLVKNSHVLDDYSTAKDNLDDLLILLKVTGAFEDDPIIRQRACTFISDNLFEEKAADGNNNPCRVVGDNIHRIFHFSSVHDEFNPKFVEFFMNNFKELMNIEREKSGFIERVYLNFQQISDTCTSNKGEQRKLKVTMEKCINYLSTIKFDDVKKEEKEFAELIGEWFDGNDAWLLAKSIYKESLDAPRNIFTKIEYVEDGKPNYDNNPDNDLYEEINSNFSYHWLPKQDYDNLILGKYCNCCAHLKGVGAGIMHASVILDCCQNLVIRNDKGRIIAKSTLYVNRSGGYAVFNNIEASLEYRDNESLKKIYEAFMRGAKAFLETYNKNNELLIDEIMIGTSRNAINAYLSGSNHPDHQVMDCLSYGTYSPKELGGTYNGDCHNSQRLVLKR